MLLADNPIPPNAEWVAVAIFGSIALAAYLNYRWSEWRKKQQHQAKLAALATFPEGRAHLSQTPEGRSVLTRTPEGRSFLSSLPVEAPSKRCGDCNWKILSWGLDALSARQLFAAIEQGPSSRQPQQQTDNRLRQILEPAPPPPSPTEEAWKKARSIGATCDHCGMVICAACYGKKGKRCPKCFKPVEFVIPSRPDGPRPVDRATTTTKLESFVYAAGKGDLAAVKQHFAEGIDVNGAVGSLARTALHDAASNGHIEIVRELVNAGALMDLKSGSGATSLLYAAKEGRLEVAQFLLEQGANIETSTLELGTPLMAACIDAHPAVVALLLKHGANTNFRDHVKNLTPLEWARRLNGNQGLDYPGVIRAFEMQFEK